MPREARERYDAVVFGADGVLVAPTDPDRSRLAIEKAFRTFGIDRPRREHVDALLDVAPEELETICEVYDLEAESFWPECDRRLARAHRRALHRGEKPLYNDVAALQSLGVDRDLLVASDHQRETIEYLLDFFGIEELFEVASGRESGVEGLEDKKPSPHPLERALMDLGVEATRTLAVGDSNADIEAARGANVDSAFLRRPRCAEYVLDSRPTHEITSLTELSTLRPEVQ
ncbi:hydrolase [Halobacteriales archaeon QH_8_64_26]|nr:MAG: hydrolase [Halobacteriales archaeon QH_8_64_26]